MVSPRP